MADQPRVLVVGGAGYIGSFTVRALVNAHCDVTVLDNLIYGHREAVPDEATFIEEALDNPKALYEIFDAGRFGAVVHFAAFAAVGESVREPLKYYRNNVVNTVNLLDAMVAHEVKKIVFSSTAATYGNPVGEMNEEHPQVPINPYGKSKLMVENILRDLADAGKIAAVALRYFNACGAAEDGSLGEDHTPETHLIPLAMQAALGLRPPLTVFGDDYDTEDGTCIRDYIHVEDLATAHLLALQSMDGENRLSFQAFNVATGRGNSVREILQAAEKVLGKPIPHTIGERRPGDPPVLVANSDKIQQTLGWKPRFVEIDETLRTVKEWMTRHPNGYGG